MKKTLALLLAGLMLISLVACKSDDNSKTTTTAAVTTPADVTVATLLSDVVQDTSLLVAFDGAMFAVKVTVSSTFNSTVDLFNVIPVTS